MKYFNIIFIFILFSFICNTVQAQELDDSRTNNDDDMEDVYYYEDEDEEGVIEMDNRNNTRNNPKKNNSLETYEKEDEIYEEENLYNANDFKESLPKESYELKSLEEEIEIIEEITLDINLVIEHPVFQSQELLGNKRFVYTSPIFLRIDNTKLDYAVFHLGKRKTGEIYLYFKIFVDNVCIKQKESMDLFMENGRIMPLINRFPVNCSGESVFVIDNKTLQRITNNKINILRYYTFNKDYKINLSEEVNEKIKSYLNYLKAYKIR